MSRFILPIAIILLSASVAFGAAPASKSVILTGSDNGKTLTLNQGSILEVRLQASAGTGYSWQIVDLDESHLEVLDTAETPLQPDRKLVGGPSLKTWRIKALAKGQTTLAIALYRPWEGIDQAADRFEVALLIR